jgi:serine protease Do
MRLLLFLALAVGVLVPTGGARAGDEADDALPPDVAQALAAVRSMQDDLVETCDTIRRLTVSVYNLQIPRQNGKPVEGEAPRPVGGGSGVLIERKRRIWVITNVHVVQGADAVQVVTYDGKYREMVVHDQIRQYDIALLSFPRQPRDLKGYTLNPSKIKASRDLQEGAWVVATGNPFHLAMDGKPVTTLGVVSGKDRILGAGFVYGSAIQHDAEVNPGNSGGPLWNRRGDLVGINGMISVRPGAGATANTGASFSIPIHQVNAFLTAMIEQGTAAGAGFLGLELKTAVDEQGNPRGAEVVRVHDKSPAGTTAKKGLRPGDVIQVVWGFGEDHRINTASDITNLLSLCGVGTFLKIKYKRGKRFYEWSGRLPARPSGGR